MDSRVTDERLKELAGPIDDITWSRLKLLKEANDLAKELQELRAQSSWVKVSERLPEYRNPGADTYERVLVFFNCRPREAMCGEFHVSSSGEQYWTPDSRRERIIPTHWMPLPKPPEEESNG